MFQKESGANVGHQLEGGEEKGENVTDWASNSDEARRVTWKKWVVGEVEVLPTCGSGNAGEDFKVVELKLEGGKLEAQFTSRGSQKMGADVCK